MCQKHSVCLYVMLLVCCLFRMADAEQLPSKSDVLFIAVDDLNHWVNYLGRNRQSITPHLNRLASWGVSFTRAYCTAPACNPSRASLMSGMRPYTTGVYHNNDDYRPWIKPDQTLNSHFRANGYHVCGAGKIYHGGGGRLEEWDDYFKKSGVKSAGAYSHEDVGGIVWGQLKGDDDVLADYHTVSYCIEQLQQKQSKPLFLACGIIRPHMPWSVPKKYFDMHPLDKIELPPYLKDDLADIPEPGIKMAKPQGDHTNLTHAGKWKEAIQAYLASMTYADTQLGRLLDALEETGRREKTIIVLWGDHGWHLGEKNHWRKFALWEEATRAPLIWVVPGTTPEGMPCHRTVDFLSIYPTLCELNGLPIPEHVEGKSIASLLKSPDAEWSTPAITTHGHQNHAVRTQKWRYIHYADGSTELYDHASDPYEWNNLATDDQFRGVMAKLKTFLPSHEREPHPQSKQKKAKKAK